MAYQGLGFFLRQKDRLVVALICNRSHGKTVEGSVLAHGVVRGKIGGMKS